MKKYLKIDNIDINLSAGEKLNDVESWIDGYDNFKFDNTSLKHFEEQLVSRLYHTVPDKDNIIIQRSSTSTLSEDIEYIFTVTSKRRLDGNLKNICSITFKVFYDKVNKRFS